MEIKFLQEKENKEAIFYIVIFALALFGLNHFVGIDLSFKKPVITFKEREDFSKIETVLEEIEVSYNFEELKPFELIQPYRDSFGRDNPFQAGGMSSYSGDRGRENVFELPDEKEEPEEEEPSDVVTEEED